MQFTTQQLRGGGKYSVKAKIGNWYEDMVLDETKFKEYISLKDSNGLLVSQKEAKYAGMLARVDLTPFSSGTLTTGHYFMFKNKKTNGFMVMDVDDRNPQYKAAFGCTTSPLMNFPCPRSLFKIEKYNDDKNLNSFPEPQPESSVCYNDKIVIVAYPSAYDFPLYLFSPLVGPFAYSRFSRNQEVLFSSEESFYNCWTIEHVDPIKRFEVMGQPVRVDQPFLIRHFQTGKLLGSDLIDYNNDYGHEFEMCANNYLAITKFKRIEADKNPKYDRPDVSRIEKDVNIWCAVDKV
jgi:hypothetical protein